MNLIQDVNDYNVAVQLTVAGNDKIRVLEGVMPDLSAIATVTNSTFPYIFLGESRNKFQYLDF